uniref:PKD domain-containing protein n=1 Tax=Streptomyces sp. NBC_00049 TaxID=2903617 RepID=A0AAU2JQD7_9ACTN
MTIVAAVGFLPGTAHAAGPGPSDAHGVTAPDKDLAKAAASNFKTFTSPADRTVRRALPAAKGKAAAAPQAQAADGNPNLGILLNASSTTAHGLELRTTITSADSALDVTVEWGDGTKDVASASGSIELSHKHTYAELGEYTVRVTVKDPANQAEVVNDFPVMTAGSDFTPLAPTRLLDTREGIGAAKGKVKGFGTARVKIAGNGKIPAGATAVVLNVTVTNPAKAGHITVFGEGGDRPTTSNVNFEAGQTVPNLVIVPVGKNGYVDLYNHGESAVDLIADVTGYFTRTQSSGYTPLNPARLVDSREGTGTRKGFVPGFGTFTTQISGRGGVPAGATAVALNVTVTEPKADGHLTVFPGGQATPATSSLNFTTGQTVANSVIVPISADGKINIRNGSWAATHVIADVVGYYSPDSTSAYLPVLPERLLDTRGDEHWNDGPLLGFEYLYMPLSWRNPNITGFALNATVTNTTDNGHLTVAPDPNTKAQYDSRTAQWPEKPNSSNLNWTTGKTVPNLVQASTGANGIIDFWNWSPGNTDVIVDIFGYYDKG